ncbi:hypothetical protein ARTHRO9AX_10213 [Arthrobacter sp. 9AX]|nr:hypothetical protein ARTHRO9AX_10213 [Arthrobacter sp. 9AX]
MTLAGAVRAQLPGYSAIGCTVLSCGIFPRYVPARSEGKTALLDGSLTYPVLLELSAFGGHVDLLASSLGVSPYVRNTPRCVVAAAPLRSHDDAVETKVFQ